MSLLSNLQVHELCQLVAGNIITREEARTALGIYDPIQVRGNVLSQTVSAGLRAASGMKVGLETERSK